MNTMTITNAQYFNDRVSNIRKGIKATIDDIDVMVPLTEGNRHYDEIMRQVAEGTLTIADAE
jgi:hypothetical protein